MSSVTVDVLVKFHVSLNVSNLARSIEFYRVLLDREPATRKNDYAKFEIEEPPLILSLAPVPARGGGNLNHVGLRLRNSEELAQVQARLESAAITTTREEGVECCYSKQTKFWVHDPDGALWEIYVLHDEADDEGHDHPAPPAKSAEDVVSAAEGGRPEVVWEHRITEPVPARIPHEDNSVDRVLLRGSANLPPETFDLRALFGEVLRVLRPGGEVRLHGLGGDKPVQRPLAGLPGPAASVKHALTEGAQAQALVAAGFVDVRFEKLSAKPYFVVDGVQLREVLLAGRKPGFRSRQAAHQAIYLGPLAEVKDDFGNVFKRGERALLNIHDWQALANGVVAGQFLLLPPEEANPKGSCCGGAASHKQNEAT
jgi:catechol 2,3-dioxygenase-like lactoylglutathione lyase family enzyme